NWRQHHDCWTSNASFHLARVHHTVRRLCATGSPPAATARCGRGPYTGAWPGQNPHLVAVQGLHGWLGPCDDSDLLAVGLSRGRAEPGLDWTHYLQPRLVHWHGAGSNYRGSLCPRYFSSVVLLGRGHG